MLRKFMMKEVSKPVGIMWANDPNKALWTILAKAYSIIRNAVGKDIADMKGFIDIMVPKVNLPSPEIYMELAGWFVTIGEDGKPHVDPNHTPNRETLLARPDSALTVEDIILHCQEKGYPSGIVVPVPRMSEVMSVKSNGNMINSEMGGNSLSDIKYNNTTMNHPTEIVIENLSTTKAARKAHKKAQREAFVNSEEHAAMQAQLMDVEVQAGLRPSPESPVPSMLTQLPLPPFMPPSFTETPIVDSDTTLPDDPGFHYFLKLSINELRKSGALGNDIIETEDTAVYQTGFAETEYPHFAQNDYIEPEGTPTDMESANLYNFIEPESDGTYWEQSMQPDNYNSGADQFLQGFTNDEDDSAAFRTGADEDASFPVMFDEPF
jgi:hypothetical protein